MGRPATECSTLGRDDFIRVPFPAASTSTCVCVISGVTSCSVTTPVPELEQEKGHARGGRLRGGSPLLGCSAYQAGRSQRAVNGLSGQPGFRRELPGGITVREPLSGGQLTKTSNQI